MSREYLRWIHENEPSRRELFLQQNTELSKQPLFSIILSPPDKPAERGLEKTRASLAAQTYARWEICPVAKTINQAMTLARGDYLVFVDAGDLLAPHALFEAAKAIASIEGADLIYSDEDKISPDRETRHDPFFKPDFSPETLKSLNYLGRLLIVKRSLAHELGFWRENFGSAQEYDFVLRASTLSPKIVHLRKILYHRRTQKHLKNRPDFAANALREYLRRTYTSEEILVTPLKRFPVAYSCRVIPKTLFPKISVVLLPNGKGSSADLCVSSLLKRSHYPNLQILFWNAPSKATLRDITVSWDILGNRNSDLPFSLNEVVLQKATGEVFVFVHPDLSLLTPCGLDYLVQDVVREDIGCAGPLILYANDRIRSAGLIRTFAPNGLERLYEGLPITYLNSPILSPALKRSLIVPSDECLAISRKHMDYIGAIPLESDPSLMMVEIARRSSELGLWNLYIPDVRFRTTERPARRHSTFRLLNKNEPPQSPDSSFHPSLAWESYKVT